MAALISVKEGEVIQLPDFNCRDETFNFISYLKDKCDKYGVKTLLYHSEMILNHLDRIDKHKEACNKILVRVNGDITPAQRKAYDMRVIETAARKFYSAMSNAGLDVNLKMQGFKESFIGHCSRNDKIDRLVGGHVARERE